MLGLRHVLWVSAALAGAAAGMAAGCGGGGETGSGGHAGAGAATTSSSAGGGGGGPSVHAGTTVSSSLQITKDDATLWVVNQDSDSVSVIDTAKSMLVDEILLADHAPAVDPSTMRFEPAVLPRALAIVDESKVYVAGESANTVYVIDAATHAVKTKIPVPAAPVAVAAAPDGSAVYVVSHEAAVLSKIDPATDKVVASLPLTEHPWAVAVSADGASVFVTHFLLDPGVSVVDAATFALKGKTTLAEEPQGSDVQIPNGVARELYAVAPNPVGGELWVLHSLLATKTPECPVNQTCSQALVFNTTIFPTISALSPDGATATRRLLFQPPVAGATGSFTDSCAGPRAVAFTPDGALALVVHALSEDVMVFDTKTGDEVSLVQPVPSALLEGIVIDHAGKHAYVDGRNTHDVTVLDIDQTSPLVPVTAESASIDRIMTDPMPTAMRHGQRLFNSANSSAFPITQNFWIACASCHPEGGSDAVTWLFAQGPRDTPSNAGGPINTGFLLRQAMRSEVQQYDATIDAEQGGSYHLTSAIQKPDLDDLALYVNYAIPFPQNPNLAPGGALTASQQRGKKTFDDLCTSCHTGPYLTDSGAGNPTLDLSGPIMLHDVGTCVTTGQSQDQPAFSYLADPYYPTMPAAGQPDRTACDFDTPTLRGIFATPPYFHDGSAATLMDVVSRLPFSSGLSDGDKADLVAYLKTL
jgi:YVTN family beta-propeller protein